MPEPYEIYPKRTAVTAPTDNSTNNMQVIPLEIGMMGFSLEEIPKGKKGWCIMPLGVRDSTKWGGRKWVRIKLVGLENVRANRDMIVADEQGQVKEHTPVELSYDKHPQGEGNYERVGEDFPLPVTNCSRDVLHYSATVTNAGFTAIVAPVVSGKKIRIHWYSISNAHVADVSVGLSFNQVDIKNRYYLPAQGGAVSSNLIDAPLGADTAEQSLYAYLSAACASGVYFNVAYTEE